MYTKSQSGNQENGGLGPLEGKNGESSNTTDQDSRNGLLSRRANAPSVGPLSSLDLLHKPPQGLASPNLYTDEEIAKNTDLNKKLGGSSASSAVTSKSSSLNSSLGPLDVSFVDEAPLPIYKKDGGLVKSSLKNRSKSLPTSPYIRDVPQRFALQRSKSVHFDQRTPVKYFELDESPLASVSREGEVEEISFQHKGVGLLQEAEPPQPQEPPKPLRKSKRFDALNKVKQIPKIQGLYPSNFPVISSRDPKVLQLNVFLSLSRDKQVFLQDLALHVFRRGASVEGKVMVKDLSYHKRVAARYTWDGWNTVHEVECIYVCSGERYLPGTNTDMFSFMLEKPDKSLKLQLCIQYVARIEGRRQEFWDNNENQNYELDVVTDSFRDPFA
ncbi:hypothetical protein ZYGR_0N07160 [Zygosaccharomyces rouxii]|uniref:CBM21 domain-containing protein n=1 Tax=Zygosaccharomyces rouxii TaxID=4956 RepID=A0A1Q3A0W0_ZYGRO|nr:hypothetical protein ZYGR_0N07160 [Zygosaccharomyces rouxii]